jgi:hypothetical protein
VSDDPCAPCPETGAAAPTRWVFVTLAGTTAVGLLLRACGVPHGLPYIYHPDEPIGVTTALRMLKRSDLDPHFFGYGSLFFYLNTFADLLYYLAGKALGAFHAAAEMRAPQMLARGVGHTAMPTLVIVDRLVSVLAGTLCVPVAYSLGSLLADRSVGLLAAVFVALSPMMVLHSIFVTPNMLATLMVMVTSLALLRLAPTSRWPSFLAVGAAFGGAVASKYNDLVLAVPCVTAFLTLYGRRTWKEGKVYLTLTAAAMAFLVCTPYAVLNLGRFIADTRFYLTYYGEARHEGMEGGPAFYAALLFKTHGVLVFIGLARIVAYFRQRNRNGLIIAALAVPYLLYILPLRVGNDRTILIIVPILLVMAADGLIALWRWVSARGRWRPAGRMAVAGLVLTSAAHLAIRTTVQGVGLLRPDGRERARQWILNTVPARTRIAAESYAPFIDPDRYDVVYFTMLRGRPPESYVTQGFDLLVLSSDCYGRFYRRRDLYAREAGEYDALLSRFPAIAAFDENGIAIRILKTRPARDSLNGDPAAPAPRFSR